ncbi:hypothetical protein V5O48_009313 [Marasmius crinis-equi]|uniref:Uncharacterized protein n=1 Tax=Marasmius crinis-equi TaxID=585013 RepID=A0ABR3FC61_9AGAR
MPPQPWLLKLLLISTALAWTAGASTVTLKAVHVPPNNTFHITPITATTTISDFISYSEAGVKSDGSETTYIREIVISEQLLDGMAFTLPTPASATGTLIQSSGGFWFSQEAVVTVYEILPRTSTTVVSTLATATLTQYQSCSLGSDGEYACVEQLLGTTVSYTATASDAVITNVGELKKDNHAVGSMAMIWQVMVVFCAMVVGGVLVI